MLGYVACAMRRRTAAAALEAARRRGSSSDRRAWNIEWLRSRTKSVLKPTSGTAARQEREQEEGVKQAAETVVRLFGPAQRLHSERLKESSGRGSDRESVR